MPAFIYLIKESVSCSATAIFAQFDVAAGRYRRQLRLCPDLGKTTSSGIRYTKPSLLLLSSISCDEPTIHAELGVGTKKFRTLMRSWKKAALHVRLSIYPNFRASISNSEDVALIGLFASRDSVPSETAR
ncbi:hypothetical protein ACU8KH_00193 [Lachancea thermotolerans]